MNGTLTLSVEDYHRKARGARSERPIQRTVIKYLTLHKNIAWVRRMNSGGAYFPKPGGGKQFVRFGFLGCPDVWAMTKQGRLVVIETKGRGDKVRTEQEIFISTCKLGGAIAGIVYTIEHFEELLPEIEDTSYGTSR